MAWNLDDQVNKSKGDLLARLAEDRAGERKISYRDALAQVSKEHPELITPAPFMPRTEPCIRRKIK